MSRRMRAALVLALAWVLYGALYVAAGLRFGRDLGRAAEMAAIPTTVAVLIGWLAWRISGWLAWPARPRASFYLAHMALALGLGLVWTISSFVIDAIEMGINPVTEALASDILGWQLMMGGWMYDLVAGVSYALRARDRLQEQQQLAARAEALATRAQLETLRAQINPHFLFNALHSLSTLVRTDQEAAERAIERLGDLLRYAVRERSRDHASLGEEWAFTRDYLDIEKLRLNGRLRVEAELPDDLLSCTVLPFTLQPLVENAVRHGIPDPPTVGNVRIAAALEGDDLVLSVADNGPGADLADLESSAGFGLRALRQRLAAEGGELGVRTGLRGGFEVVVRYPQDDPE